MKILYFLFQDESVAKCSEYFIWVIDERQKSNLVADVMKKSCEEKLLKKEYLKMIKKKNKVNFIDSEYSVNPKNYYYICRVNTHRKFH